MMGEDLLGFKRAVWDWLDMVRAPTLFITFNDGRPNLRRLTNGEVWWREPLMGERAQTSSWVFFGDGSPEDILIQWRGVVRRDMETLIGRPLSDEELQDQEGHPLEFPPDWGFIIL